LDDIDVNRNITLEWMLEKDGVKFWTGFLWLIPFVGSCEHGKETSGSMKSGEFLD
jgi:hypothetical protein